MTNNVLNFQTAQGSIYTYDPSGRTTRYKTATHEQNNQQDVTVFVKLSPQQEQDFLEAYRSKVYHDGKRVKVYVAEEQSDGSGRIIERLEDIHFPDKLELVGIDGDSHGRFVSSNVVLTAGATLIPTLGLNTFDTRSFIDKSGGFIRERHLGNKVTQIEYVDQSVTPTHTPTGDWGRALGEAPSRASGAVATTPESAQQQREGAWDHISQLGIQYNIAIWEKGNGELKTSHVRMAIVKEKFADQRLIGNADPEIRARAYLGLGLAKASDHIEYVDSVPCFERAMTMPNISRKTQEFILDQIASASDIQRKYGNLKRAGNLEKVYDKFHPVVNPGIRKSNPEPLLHDISQQVHAQSNRLRPYQGAQGLG